MIPCGLAFSFCYSQLLAKAGPICEYPFRCFTFNFQVIGENMHTHMIFTAQGYRIIAVIEKE